MIPAPALGDAAWSEHPLLPMLRAITIHSPVSFSIGQEVVSLDTATGGWASRGGVTTAPVDLITLLQQQLYQRAYCVRLTDRRSEPAGAGGQAQDLVDDLSAANASRERWEGGWIVQKEEALGQILVQKGPSTRLLSPGEFIVQEAGMPPRAGAPVAIFVPRESRTLQPGFYFAFGESLADQLEEQRILRLYWNIGPDGAADLVRHLSRALNQFQVPFRLKVVTTRPAFARIDAAVLYIGRRYYAITGQLLEAAYPASLARLLAPQTPLFTKELAPGLGFAEDPGAGQSFGMNRCRIVAEAIWNAFCQGSQSADIRLRELAAQFARYGLALDRPYLNPGSIDRYEFAAGRGLS